MRLSIFFVLLLAPVRGWTEGQLPAGACAPGSVQSCAPAGVFTTAPAPGHGTAQVPGSESFTFTAADVVHSSEPPRAPELSGAVPFAPGEWTVPPWDGPWRDGDGTLPGMIPGWTTPDPVALNTTGTFAPQCGWSVKGGEWKRAQNGVTYFDDGRWSWSTEYVSVANVSTPMELFTRVPRDPLEGAWGYAAVPQGREGAAWGVWCDAEDPQLAAPTFSAHVLANRRPKEAPPLPDGWSVGWSAREQRPYYYRTTILPKQEDGAPSTWVPEEEAVVATWELPPEARAAAPKPPPQVPPPAAPPPQAPPPQAPACSSISLVNTNVLQIDADVPDYAFNRCPELAGVTVRVVSAATRLGAFSFAETGVVALETADAGSIAAVGNRAFSKCASLASVSLDGVVEVGRGVFQGSGVSGEASREPSFAFSFVPGDSAKIMGANMSCANVTYSTMAPAMAGMPVQELYRCVGANARQNASLLWPKGRLRWEGGAHTAAVQPT